MTSAMVPPNPSSAHSSAKRGAAAAGSFDVRIVEHEPRVHQFVLVIHLAAAQMKETLRAEQDASPVFLKDFVFRLGKSDRHFVLETRAAALDDFDSQSVSLGCSGQQDRKSTRLNSSHRT